MILYAGAERYKGRTLKGFLYFINKLIDERVKDELYRVYITDALKTIADNTARIAGGSSMKRRWYEIANPKANEPAHIDNACDFVQNALDKAGIKVV